MILFKPHLFCLNISTKINECFILSKTRVIRNVMRINQMNSRRNFGKILMCEKHNIRKRVIGYGIARED